MVCMRNSLRFLSSSGFHGNTLWVHQPEDARLGGRRASHRNGSHRPTLIKILVIRSPVPHPLLLTGRPAILGILQRIIRAAGSVRFALFIGQAMDAPSSVDSLDVGLAVGSTVMPIHVMLIEEVYGQGGGVGARIPAGSRPRAGL